MLFIAKFSLLKNKNNLKINILSSSQILYNLNKTQEKWTRSMSFDQRSPHLILKPKIQII